MTDHETYARLLREADRLREPVIRSAILRLGLPQGSRGLDVGCGIGSHTVLLAETIGPAGHVTGLDSCPEFLAEADERASHLGMSHRVSFDQGDAASLPYEDGSFDWAWSVDCLGFAGSDPARLAAEAVRVVRPMGKVAVLVWSSQLLLPGYPVLEARLNATSLGIAPFTAARAPESHHLRALGWLEKAGLADLRADTFAGTIHAPLSEDVRDAMASLFEMRWGSLGDGLSKADQARYESLTRPGSPDCVLDRPDYYAFFTYSMFYGLKS
jgi:ubiquinone/menaquinone biosynthesis C-methylase UbiE